MSEAFLKIVNMSISASWLVLAVLALRLILKKAPKWVNVLLWGIVAIRLICPFSIESALSLIPSAETISPEILTDATPTVTTGIASLNSVVNPIISESFAPATGASANPLQIWIPIFSVIWAVGFVAMLLYTAVSYWRIRKKVSTAVILRDNIFHSEYAGSPFVLGIIKPRIYLPYNMDKQNREHVIAHEQAHIRRKDHWWKPLGFLLLTIHWFNPLMWVAYILLCRDIEMACDEKVIAELGNEQRANYTQALVACSINRRLITACPLAFGKVGVKERVKSIMNYRKPTFLIILTALVVCVVLAVCFLTNPKEIKTPMHILDSLSADDVQWVQITIWEEESVHIQLTDEQIHELMGILKKLDDRDFVRAKAIERDVSLMIYCGETELLLHWDGEFTAFNFDSTTSEEIDDEYCYVNSDELNLYLSNFYPIRSRMSTPAVKWFDYTLDPSGMSYDEEFKIQLDEFPGITFKYTPYDIIATTSWEDSDLVGRTILISGLPIWNAYFCDLTGDGLPEICSQVSYGSGMIDNRVIIFDYANGISYKLEDRGYHDYYLRINDADGYLYVDKRVYNSDELVSSGRLVFKDGCIQVEGVSSEPLAVLQAKVLEINDRYFLVAPVEGSWELSSADKIEVPMKNMSPSPEPQVGDIIEIQYNGEILENYPARLSEVYSIRVVEEDNVQISMVPTSAKMSGLFDAYLYLTIDGATYRYERQTTDTESVEAGEFLDTLYEDTGFETYSYEVYSIKGCDDLSMVLAVNPQYGGGVYCYSPSKRCDESALQDAKDAGFVVMEDGDATSGQESWLDFYETTQQGKAASITVAHYHTLAPEHCSSTFYEAYKEDYPSIYILELSFDGNVYTLKWDEYGTTYTRTYEYLMRYVTNNYSVVSSTLPENTIQYVLTHDDTVTWKDLFNGLVSSQMGAYIDHHTIYTDKQ